MAPTVLLPLGATERKSDEQLIAPLREAGLEAFVIRPGTPIAPAFDGLVLAGGTDIDPARYGARPHPANYPPEPARDALEIALIAEAVAARTPVFAICRGMQMLNVALGGALVQHLPDIVGHERHADPAPVGEKHRAAHTVVIEQPGRLRDLLGTDPIAVNSRHHQAVHPDRLGTGLHVVARADDGTVEALDWDLPQFLVAVQWHPEDIALGPPGPMREQARVLYEAFAAAVRELAG